MTQYFISLDRASGDLLSCAAYLAERVAGGDERAEAISAVVPRYLARGEVDLSAELANSVEDPFVRDRLLIAVAAKCAEFDDDEYAFQLAEAIDEYGLQSQAREAIAIQKAAKNEFEKAREIAGMVIHPDHVLSRIAERQAANGDLAAASETAANIDFPASAAAAWMAMGYVRIGAGDNEKAIEFLENALPRAEDIEHNEERIRILIDAGNLFKQASRGDRAIATLDRAKQFAEELDNVHRDSLLASISIGLMHAGSIDLADRTLDLVADKTQIANTLLGFAREYSALGEKDDGLEALSEAYDVLRSQHERETRDSNARFALFAAIAAQFAAFERGERAIEIAEGIEDENHSMSALSQIAQLMTLSGKNEIARNALNAIPGESSRVYALIGMSDAAREIGDGKAAIDFLNEALTLADEVPQISSRANALAETARRFFDMDERERARELASLNLETVAGMRGKGTRVAALAAAAEFFENAKFSISESDAAIIKSMLTDRSVA